jgi:hypothetical protein
LKKTELFLQLKGKYSLDTLSLEEISAFSLGISRKDLFLQDEINEKDAENIHLLTQKVAF